MKIVKGHYVPKELITSEALHEAVVKAFVAAGFNKIGHCNYGSDIGAGGLGVSTRIAGGIIEKPLTLQQLFTAENGICWPDWAECIDTDGKAVWFHGHRAHELIAGEIGSGPVIMTLATRQPKDKELKTIEDAVIKYNGKWPIDEFMVSTEDQLILECIRYADDTGHDVGEIAVGGVQFSGVFYRRICNKAEFESCAKRLGYINGYRWGVEYPTNGKRPELGDGCLIDVNFTSSGNDWHSDSTVSCWRWDLKQIKRFRITDQRYKPADTSYLDASTQSQSLTHSAVKDLSDLSFAISDAVSIAVDAGANDVAHNLQEINKSVLAKQKANLERKKVIDCAAERVGGIVDMEPLLNELYDAGMLVMPK